METIETVDLAVYESMKSDLERQLKQTKADLERSQNEKGEMRRTYDSVIETLAEKLRE